MAILKKPGEAILVIHTKFHQNRMKNKKVLLIACLTDESSVNNILLGVVLDNWSSAIVAENYPNFVAW